MSSISSFQSYDADFNEKLFPESFFTPIEVKEQWKGSPLEILSYHPSDLLFDNMESTRADNSEVSEKASPQTNTGYEKEIQVVEIVEKSHVLIEKVSELFKNEAKEVSGRKRTREEAAAIVARKSMPAYRGDADFLEASFSEESALFTGSKVRVKFVYNKEAKAKEIPDSLPSLKKIPRKMVKEKPAESTNETYFTKMEITALFEALNHDQSLILKPEIEYCLELKLHPEMVADFLVEALSNSIAFNSLIQSLFDPSEIEKISSVIKKLAFLMNQKKNLKFFIGLWSERLIGDYRLEFYNLAQVAKIMGIGLAFTWYMKKQIIKERSLKTTNYVMEGLSYLEIDLLSNSLPKNFLSFPYSHVKIPSLLIDLVLMHEKNANISLYSIANLALLMKCDATELEAIIYKLVQESDATLKKLYGDYTLVYERIYNLKKNLCEPIEMTKVTGDSAHLRKLIARCHTVNSKDCKKAPCTIKEISMKSNLREDFLVKIQSLVKAYLARSPGVPDYIIIASKQCGVDFVQMIVNAK